MLGFILEVKIVLSSGVFESRSSVRVSRFEV